MANVAQKTFWFENSQKLYKLMYCLNKCIVMYCKIMRMDYVSVYVDARSTQHSQLERLFNLAMIIVLAEERSGLGVAFTNRHIQIFHFPNRTLYCHYTDIPF